MTKAPWFPLYTADFLASSDVQLMEAHEVGSYLLLMIHSWQSDAPGYLPDDEGRLRRLCRLSVEQWKECRELLLSKWPRCPEDGAIRYNKRLLKEASKQVEIREIKAEAGRKSAERRARISTEGQQTVNTNPTPVEINPTYGGQKPNYSQSQSQSQSQVDKSTTSLRSVTVAKESENFTSFWMAYPRKEAKANALKAFAKMSPDEQAGAAQAAREWFGRRSDWIGADGSDYRPHAATWIGQKRWQDLTEITITQTPTPHTHGNPSTTNQQHGDYQRSSTAPSKFVLTDTDALAQSEQFLGNFEWTKRRAN